MVQNICRLLLGSVFCLTFSFVSLSCHADETADLKQNETETKYEAKTKFREKEEWEKQLLKKIPYAEDLKPVWDVIDGDVDLMGITNLRADRRNHGISYKTNTLPLIGTTQAVTYTFKAGDENSFSFETGYIPFAGELKGFKLHGYVGDHSRISARYTIPLDF